MEKIKVVHANLNNQGGAFSVVYEVQQEVKDEFIFDYFSAEKFIENDIYNRLIQMGSSCIGGVDCPNRLFKQYEVYKAFKTYLINNPHDYVHIHADTAWKISVYYLAAKKAGVENIVVHSHSSGISGHYKNLNYLLHVFTKPIIKNAKYRCACSDIAAKWMFNTNDKVMNIRNGVDINRFSFNNEKRDKTRNQLGIDNKIVIGSISDFSYPKNPEFIFELIRKFKNDSRYVFLLVGNRENCVLVDWVNKDISLNNVIFTGQVTNIPDYLSVMDIFILPSRFEGLPMCALEAQVSGLYTIISDKVTPDTQCSRHFKQLKLDAFMWKKEIESVDLNYDRESMDKYLDIENASASNTADKFRTIYTERG